MSRRQACADPALSSPLLPRLVSPVRVRRSLARALLTHDEYDDESDGGDGGEGEVGGRGSEEAIASARWSQLGWPRACVRLLCLSLALAGMHRATPRKIGTVLQRRSASLSLSPVLL